MQVGQNYAQTNGQTENPYTSCPHMTFKVGRQKMKNLLKYFFSNCFDQDEHCMDFTIYFYWIHRSYVKYARSYRDNR